MTDEVVIRQEPREVCPEGQYSALCVDLIALGMKVQTFEGKETGACEACALVFVIAEKNSKGYAFTLVQELNVTTGQRSKLVKFLQQWRGKSFTADELGTGFTLSAYVGKTALVSVINKVSRLGNKRAEIATIMPLPAGLPAPTKGDYKRPEFWVKQKQRYAEEYSAFMGKTMKELSKSVDDPTPDEDSAPF